MSTISTSAYASYDSSSDRDDQVLAIKASEKCSLNKAIQIRTAIAKERGDTEQRGNIFQSMLDYLVEAPRTEAEFTEWVKTNGSENTMRWIKTHDKMRVAINKVHEQYSEPKATSRSKKSA